MSIRRHLAVGLSSILLLFALNLGVSLWGNVERDAGLAELRQALSRQIVIASIRQRLNDLQKEIALLSQVYGEASPARSGPEELARLQSRLDAVRKDVAEARRLSPSEPVGEFPKFFEELALSWRAVYENLGVDNTRAIKELSIRAEPLAQMVIGGLLREWESREKARVERARADLDAVETVVRRTAVSIFVVTALLAALIAYFEWRSLVHTSEELERRVEERTRELQQAQTALKETEERYRRLFP